MLDNPEAILAGDPKGIYGMASGFADQCIKALEIARAAKIPNLAIQPTNAILLGMGGSAAGGDLVAAVFAEEGKIPFLVNREYRAPSYCGSSSLVFAASYSGNTEETLSAYAQAHASGAQIIAVTTGGELGMLALSDGHTLIQVPGGLPPRMALGYMLVPVLVTCERLGLIPEQPWEAVIQAIRDSFDQSRIEVPTAQNEAKQIASELFGAVGVIYGLGVWQGAVAGRWKCQLNENSKCLAFSKELPEMNHNEILGWINAPKQGVQTWRAYFLEDGTESKKMRLRADYTERCMTGSTSVRRVQAKAAGLLPRIFELTYLADFVSLYLAALYGVDPENIDWLTQLKLELGAASS